MPDWKIYTPDGVRDIIFEECYRKRQLENRIRNLFRKCGYNEVETPTLEFYDVFSEGGYVPQEAMFKTLDQQGRILVMRPDITVPVARIAATKCRNNSWPLKFFYIGNTFNFQEMGGGKQKEFTQAGVEVLGVNTPQSDAEVIAMAVNTVKASGLKDFRIDIGQVGFFKGLMEDSGMSEKDMEQMRMLIENKDYVGIEELFAGHDIKEDLKKLVFDLPGSSGNPDSILSRFESMAVNGKSIEALDNLKKVIRILQDYNLEKYISVDLGMIQSMNYYTGIIFRGFTHGVGFPILSGGRYDNLVEKFGEKCPATGFALGINMTLAALQRQNKLYDKPTISSLITFDSEGRKTALQISEELRSQGLVVEMDITGYSFNKLKKYAKDKNIGGILYVKGTDNIEIYNMATGNKKNVSLSELLKKT